MKPLDPDNLQLELVDDPPLDVGPLVRAALTTDLLAAVDDTEETVAARSRVHVLDNGICVTCRPVAARAHFDPSLHPHDPHDGEFISTPGGAASSALKDALNLAGKIDLGPGEKLIGSDKLNTRGGNIRLAMTDTHGVKSLRLGIGGEGFGGRHDGPWRGNRDATAELNAQRKPLRDELQHLDELDHRTPAQQARLDELDNMDLGEVGAAGYTAKLDQAAAEKLRKTLSTALGVGKKVQAELDAADREGRPEPPRPEQGFWTIAEGSIPGDWADVFYNVYLDDPSVGVEVHLGAAPHGSGQSLEDLTGAEQAARLDPADAQRLVRLLGKYVSAPAERSIASRSTVHELVDGICVTCTRTVARFDPHEPREPHSGKWVKTPGGGKGAAEKFKKFMGHLEDGDNDSALAEAEKLDLADFGALTPRQQKDLQDELENFADSKFVDPGHKSRAQSVLENLGLRGSKKTKTSPKAPKPTPKVVPKTSPKLEPSAKSPGRFDEAAREVDALDAAPTRVRALYEAGLTPAERKQFLAEVDAMSDKAALQYGGRGARSTIGEHEHISIEDRDRLAAAADEYMQKAYIPINEALYGDGPHGAGVTDETRQWIDDLDRLLQLSRIDQDAIYHRGTVLPANPPDEMTLPGFTSMTHSGAIATGFVTGDLFGAEAGGKGRAGVPTVMTLRVPQGTHAMQFSPQDVLGEVLLHRGARIRRVEADDFDGLQIEGVNYVTYEVI